MKLLKISSISFLVLYSLLLVTPAFAVETPPVVKTTTATTAVKPASNVVVLATVNIQNAKIISQKDNLFNISFSMTNGTGVQTGVKYGVELLSIDPKNQYTADEKVYPESFSLPSGTNFSKSFMYQAPKTLAGTYNLFLVSKNESGLMLGRVSLGKVTLKATLQGIEILPSTCYLQVVGENGSPHYTLTQAVEIAKNETLNLTCNINNTLNNTIDVKPVFETLSQSAYGKVAPQTGGSIEAITIAPKETKTFTVTLPTVNTPQVYSANVKLTEPTVTSNTINALYTLSGPQATILNLTLDKNSYKKDESAKISLVYTSAGVNPKSRIKNTSALTNFIVKATMVNENGKECITPISQALVQDLKNPKVEIPATIKNDCLNPKVSVTLLDDKGNVLDQKDFLTKPGSYSNQVQTTTPTKSNKLAIIFTIIGLLIVAGVAYYFINLKKKQNETNPQ